jgi:NTE family protein
MPNLHKRALVLSGGGGRGAYHVGVYKYLEEQGLTPDIIVGTSIGAVNGAMLAAGMNAADLECEWRALTTDQIQRLRLNPLEYFEKPSLLDNSPWADTLERQISFHKVRTSDKTFLVTSTDIRRGGLRVFRKEEITVRHILASCSIPVIYPWTDLDGDLLWDGAVVANTPLRPAIDEGAEEIYVVLLSPAGARELPPPPNLLDAAAHAFDMALLASFEFDLKQVEKVNRRVREGRDASSHRIVNVRVIAPSENIPAAWILKYDPQNTDYLIRLGYEDARRVLAQDQASAA